MGGRHRKNAIGHFSFSFVAIQADVMVRTTCMAAKGILKRRVSNYTTDETRADGVYKQLEELT